MTKPTKKKWVEFPNGATVPGSMLGKDCDQKIQPKTPVLLPVRYADHVVEDGFAIASAAPKKKAPAKKQQMDGIDDTDPQAGEVTGQPDEAQTDLAQAKEDEASA